MHCSFSKQPKADTGGSHEQPLASLAGKPCNAHAQNLNTQPQAAKAGYMYKSTCAVDACCQVVTQGQMYGTLAASINGSSDTWLRCCCRNERMYCR